MKEICELLFYNFFDSNQDRLVCESDLFLIFKSMTSELGIDLVYEDLKILMQKIA